MNFLKKCLATQVLACALFAHNAIAKNVPYIEDAYFAQAPHELLVTAEKAAALTHFESNYEVRIPKKAILQTTPLYAFTAKASNPQTNEPVIIINPAWFSSLSQDEQDFMLARYFVTFKMGAMPLSATLLAILFIFLSMLLFAISFLILRKTRFASQKVWVRIFIALGIVVVAELAVLDRMHKRLELHLSTQHEIAIIQKTIEYTGNTEAAIKALEHVDSSIKEAVKNGDTAWAPYEHIFGQLAEEVSGK